MGRFKVYGLGIKEPAVLIVQLFYGYMVKLLTGASVSTDIPYLPEQVISHLLSEIGISLVVD